MFESLRGSPQWEYSTLREGEGVGASEGEPVLQRDGWEMCTLPWVMLIIAPADPGDG